MSRTELDSKSQERVRELRHITPNLGIILRPDQIFCSPAPDPDYSEIGRALK
jgi:hypothetical protein